MAWLRVVIFLYTILLFFLVIILSLLECMLFFVNLFNVFDMHREKYAKPDFVNFISLEINYFVATGCFVFKKYRHTFLPGNKNIFKYGRNFKISSICVSLCMVFYMILLMEIPVLV